MKSLLSAVCLLLGCILGKDTLIRAGEAYAIPCRCHVRQCATKCMTWLLVALGAIVPAVLLAPALAAAFLAFRAADTLAAIRHTQ